MVYCQLLMIQKVQGLIKVTMLSNLAKLMKFSKQFSTLIPKKWEILTNFKRMIQTKSIKILWNIWDKGWD